MQEATILLEPFRFLPWPDFFEFGQIKLPPHLAEVLDLETPIKAKAQSLGAVELARLYREADVPVHRYAFKELSSFVSAPARLSAEAFTALLPGIKLDQSIVDLLFPKTDGDTSFEELRCIGLDPNTPDTLVGVIQVKKPSGYSGGPCTDGSREYVTFWADFDGNGSFETCLGTASVSVYDIADFPAGGVYYAVRLPVDLSPYRQACTGRTEGRAHPRHPFLERRRPLRQSGPRAGLGQPRGDADPHRAVGPGAGRQDRHSGRHSRRSTSTTRAA